MMTLMGLSVSVGVLVANSIVVIENIFRFKSMGMDNREAAYKGTAEVVIAVMASTLTNLVVFLPIANMSSMIGMWLKELALAAVFATIFSLIMSFTLTPMLASMLLPKVRKPKNKIAAAFERMEEKSTNFYSAILERVLRTKRNSWLITGATVLIFIIVMMVFAPRIGFEFLPAFDDGKLRLEIELPEGYNIDETAVVLEKIENKIKSLKEVTHILTDIGKKSELDIGTNMATMLVQLVPEDQRKYKLTEMRDLFVKELSDMPNAMIKVDLASNTGGPGAPVLDARSTLDHNSFTKRSRISVSLYFLLIFGYKLLSMHVAIFVPISSSLFFPMSVRICVTSFRLLILFSIFSTTAVSSILYPSAVLFQA